MDSSFQFSLPLLLRLGGGRVGFVYILQKLGDERCEDNCFAEVLKIVIVIIMLNLERLWEASAHFNNSQSERGDRLGPRRRKATVPSSSKFISNSHINLLEIDLAVYSF